MWNSGTGGAPTSQPRCQPRRRRKGNLKGQRWIFFFRGCYSSALTIHLHPGLDLFLRTFKTNFAFHFRFPPLVHHAPEHSIPNFSISIPTSSSTRAYCYPSRSFKIPIRRMSTSEIILQSVFGICAVLGIVMALHYRESLCCRCLSHLRRRRRVQRAPPCQTYSSCRLFDSL